MYRWLSDGTWEALWWERSTRQDLITWQQAVVVMSPVKAGGAKGHSQFFDNYILLRFDSCMTKSLMLPSALSQKKHP